MNCISRSQIFFSQMHIKLVIELIAWLEFLPWKANGWQDFCTFVEGRSKIYGKY